MSKKQKLLAALAATVISQTMQAQPREEIESLKSQIVTLAESYQGQGDPDQKKQKALEVLVNKLIQKSPMPPIKDRIGILAGVWKQVWGPYDYRNDDGGVDPNLGVREIYQVVFAEGYYYNVSPIYKKGDRQRERIGLLRGVFKLDPNDSNSLRVKFTKYPGVEPRPENTNIWDLAVIAEAGNLKNRVSIVPTWIVKLFFGGGKLEEVYTDDDLRLVYGSNGKHGARRSLYVMTRVNASSQLSSDVQ